MSWVLLFSILSGFFRGTDPYYEMEAQNLNTMNSYFIPSTDLSAGEKLEEYSDVANTYNPEYTLNISDVTANGIIIHIMSSYVWVALEILIIIIIGILVHRWTSWFSMIFKSLFERIYNFFEGIMGEDKPMWMTNYVTTLFFVILFANLMGLFNDVIRFFFPRRLRNVTSATAELEFNVALAIIAVVISLYVQAKNIWFRKFLHEYIPITGKWLLEGNSIGAKIGDILISLFIGFLDIVGTFAKVISLSMRLFGNMSSGSILLNVAFLGLWAMSVALIWINLPALLPIVVYVQGLLVAFVQAFVFSLLVSIFIKMSAE